MDQRTIFVNHLIALANWGKNRMTSVSKIVLPRHLALDVSHIGYGYNLLPKDELDKSIRFLLSGEGKFLGIPLEFE